MLMVLFLLAIFLLFIEICRSSGSHSLSMDLDMPHQAGVKVPFVIVSVLEHLAGDLIGSVGIKHIVHAQDERVVVQAVSPLGACTIIFKPARQCAMVDIFIEGDENPDATLQRRQAVLSAFGADDTHVLWAVQTRSGSSVQPQPSPNPRSSFLPDPSPSQTNSELVTNHAGDSSRTFSDREKMLSDLSLRKALVSDVHSNFHHIEVWETVDPSIEYHVRPATNVSTGIVRNMLVDGTMAVSTEDAAIYHEALVHPSFSLGHPIGARRVLILGGSNGGTLREVLMYSSVMEVVLVEEDEVLINLAKAHLPELSDCRGLDTPNCFDDPRVSVYHMTPLDYMKRMLGRDACTPFVDNKERRGLGTARLFDAILIDVLDVSEQVDTLHSWAFLRQLWCMLDGKGFLATSLGATPDPRTIVSKEKLDRVERLAEVFDAMLDSPVLTTKDPRLGNVRTAGYIMHVYDTFLPSVHTTWSFAAISKSRFAGQRWQVNTARVNLELRRRLLPIRHLRSPIQRLQFYDGAVHQQFRQVPKRWQTTFCQDPEHSMFCKNGWLGRPSIYDGVHNGSIAQMEPFNVVKDDRVGLKPVARVDIDEGSCISLTDVATSFKIAEFEFMELRHLAHTTKARRYMDLVGWIEEYAYFCNSQGGHFYTSLLSKMTFTNHGCNNISGMQVNIGATVPTPANEKEAENLPSWNPVLLRAPREECGGTRAIVPIRKGEAIWQDYTTYELGKVMDAEANRWCGMPAVTGSSSSSINSASTKGDISHSSQNSGSNAGKGVCSFDG